MVDFNDMSISEGKEAVAKVINKGFENLEQQSVAHTAEDDGVLLNPPPVMPDEGYHGILAEMIRVSTKTSEASPVAIAANAIATFSALVGRRAFQHIGDGVCHCRPFFLLTGRTGKSRKGTSEYTPRRIFNSVEDLLNIGDYPLKRHEGGLSTGEGLGWAIRDETLNKDDEVIDEGVLDKRLYIVEAEFAGAMAAASREKNNLSATIRTAWDGRPIEPLVKNNRWKASDPHIVITGHITASELIDRMSDVDAQSGFLNRFVILHIVRPKLVPLPKRTPDTDVNRIAQQLKEAVDFALAERPLAKNELESRMSTAATRLWCELYPELTQEHDGIVGSLLVRTEVYCRMFAMIFALLDKTTTIEPQHIKAALAWVNYWRDSVQYIFGTLAAKAEAERMSEQGKVVLDFLKEHPGSSKTEITKKFKNSMKAGGLTEVLNHLLNAAPPLIRQITETRADGKSGKPLTRFYPA